MATMHRTGAFFALVVLVGLGPQAAGGAARQPCGKGTFLVAGAPLLPDPDLDPPDRVMLRDGTISLASGCPPVPVELRATRRGTYVRARWPECSDLAEGVRLSAYIQPGCGEMTGRLRSERPRARRRFTALREAEGSECDAGHPCPEDQLCELPAGSCEGADLEGLCADVPEGCAAVWDPVCGCDGRTYGNDCERQRARVTLAHGGRCRGETPCGPDLLCDSKRQICVAREPVGPAIVYSCQSVPEGCEGDRGCACAGKTLCDAPFDTCRELGGNALSCECVECQ